jgi:hypothetical protein
MQFSQGRSSTQSMWAIGDLMARYTMFQSGDRHYSFPMYEFVSKQRPMVHVTQGGLAGA